MFRPGPVTYQDLIGHNTKEQTAAGHRPGPGKGSMTNRVKRSGKFLSEIFSRPEPVPPFRYREFIFFGRFAGKFWKPGAAGILLALAGSGLGSILPLGGKVLIDYAVMKKPPTKLLHFLSSVHLPGLAAPVLHLLGSIPLVVLSLLLAGVAAGAVGIIQKYLLIRFQQEFTFAIQSSLFDHLLKFPLSYFRKSQTGYLMARVSDDILALQVLFSEGIAHAVTRFFYLIFGIAIILALSVKLALVTACILPVYAFINYFFAGRLRGIAAAERETGARVTRDIQEVLSGMETIKAYTSEGRETGRVSGGMRSVADTRIKRMALSLFSDYSARACRFVLILAVMWLGADEMAKGGLTVGDYIAVTSYAIFLSGAVDGVFMFRLMLQPAYASMGRLTELFGLAAEHEQAGEAVEIPPSVQAKGEVTFANVSFAYDGRKQVLKDISFSARPGEIIAVTGPSGAGKTTLVNLMLRFCTPQSGTIRLDGHDLKRLPAKWLREQIGIVTQEPFLFNESIEKNIRYGKPAATHEEVISAARMAGIHDEIGKMPEGYGTVIGERGLKLSAGQRQRISIARAILKNPPVLIFDEPAASLDAHAEALIRESIVKLSADRTVFVIAHRSTMLNMADRVVAISDGEAVETSVNRSPSRL